MFQILYIAVVSYVV